MNSRIEKIFGDKIFLKTLTKMFFPAAFQAMLSIAVLYIDNFSLALLLNSDNTEAKTALGLSGPVMTFLIMLLSGWFGGTSIMMSQYFGSKEYHKTRQIALYRIWSAILMSLPFVILFMSIPQKLIMITSNIDPIGNATILKYATTYLFFSAWTYIPYIIALGLSFSLQETKRANVSFFAAVVGVLTNFILDPIFIYFYRDEPNLAILFVAISTGIARIIQCLVVLIYVFRKKNDPINFLHNWTIKKDVFKITNKNAMSIFINDFIYALANMFLMISLLVFNPNVHDSMTNLQLILQFTTVIWPGMASSCSVLIGSELGKGNIEKAKENSKKLITWGIIIALILALILIAVSFWINPILSPGSKPESIILSMHLEWIMAPIILSQGVFSILYYAIRSGGSKLVVLSDALVMAIWMVIIPPLTFAGLMNNVNPILYLFIIESNQLFKMLVAYIIYKKTNWALSLTSKNDLAQTQNIDKEMIF
ncbi:MAG: MATE family efflux transporter [Metamycoplasmataceae bacterium]